MDSVDRNRVKVKMQINLDLKKGEDRQKVVHYSVDFVQKTSVLIKVVTQLSQSLNSGAPVTSMVKGG